MPAQAARRLRLRFALRFVLAASIAFCLAVSPAADSQPKVRIGDKKSEQLTFDVKIVDTPELLMRGLSGSDPLAKNEGMLFVFDHDGGHSIWMKEMRFSLDIIWISRFGSVVHIERNVHPDTYPRAFTSRKPARYVLEILAEAGEKIVPGAPVYFENVPLRARRKR